MGLPERPEGAVDFSAPAIRRHTLRETLEHPAAVYPAVAGLLGLAAGAAFDASLWLLGSGALGLLAAVAAFGINFGLRREQFARAYVERMMRTIEARREQQVAAIAAAFDEYAFAEGSAQFARLKEHFSAFREVVDQKFTRGELAHARYLGVIEQVYLAALDNLGTVVNTLRALAVVDASYIEKRLRALEGQKDPHTVRERAALTEQLALRSRRVEKVRELLAMNEAAMAQMDQALAAVSDIRSSDTQAAMDLESAMAELARIAARAKELPT